VDDNAVALYRSSEQPDAEPDDHKPNERSANSAYARRRWCVVANVPCSAATVESRHGCVGGSTAEQGDDERHKHGDHGRCLPDHENGYTR